MASGTRGGGSCGIGFGTEAVGLWLQEFRVSGLCLGAAGCSWNWGLRGCGLAHTRTRNLKFKTNLTKKPRPVATPITITVFVSR